MFKQLRFSNLISYLLLACVLPLLSESASIVCRRPQLQTAGDTEIDSERSDIAACSRGAQRAAAACSDIRLQFQWCRQPERD
ncbi:hypothetical protein evm_009553 [Chilo suppressalis]|nr:hypothetical protein evm_009553 [Chilo suppressalis]